VRRIAAQGRSYICFGPMSPVKVPLPALAHALNHVGRQQRPRWNCVEPTRRTR